MPSKILVVADQPVVRFGLCRLLSQEQDLELCGEAEDLAGALRQIEVTRPHLALIGVPLERKLYADRLPHFKALHPHMKILVGTRTAEPSLAVRFLRFGADGCVHWGEPVAKILAAVRSVLGGDVYFGDSASKRLVKAIIDGTDGDGDGYSALSDREINIFAMIGQGLTTQQIAESLDVSPRTVESHRKKIKSKLQIRSAADLNRRAYQWWRDIS